MKHINCNCIRTECFRGHLNHWTFRMEEVHLRFMVFRILLVFLYVVGNTLVHQGVPLHDGHVQVFHSPVDFPVYLSQFTHENKFVHVSWEAMWLIFVELGNQILQTLHKLPLNCLHFFRILQWCSICKIGLNRVISLLKLLVLSEVCITFKTVFHF